MAGQAGRRSNIDYIKPSEPSFLTKFKQQTGYKEGPGVETKREIPSFDDEDDRPEADDEKPAIVVLRDGDLTQEEAEKYAQGADNKDEDTPSLDGKIFFKKPVKRPTEDGAASDLNASSSKKEKKDKRRSGSEKNEGKKVKNASLLSFGDEEEDDET